ncbi:MAG: RNA-binding protein [Methanobacteriaceae archaeon]|nr:RNA-binding protein [Methanobacteriaceae archaeon]MDP3033534.1 RNA-binding protein [Methanobacteriaceae archaeon]MDP3622356.1 RNA-binding protein [Methanobacteriaceae archaeon]
MIHNISYRVFIQGTERPEKVEESLKTIFPMAEPEIEQTEGYYLNPVTILSQKITKKREIKEFIQKLREMNKEDIIKISYDFEKKMDDNGNFFLRFDKQEALKGNWKVVGHGDSIHVRIKIAAYPAKKDVAIRITHQIFETD